MRLKITVCVSLPIWGKFWTQRYKETKNPTASFEQPTLGDSEGQGGKPAVLQSLGSQRVANSRPDRPD